MASGEAEALLEAAETNGIGVWRLSAAGEFAPTQICNRIIGFTASTAPFGDFLDCVDANFRERIARAAEAALSQAGDVPFNEEFPFRRPDGRVIWLKGTAKAVSETAADGTGAVRLVGVLRDLSVDRRNRAALGEERLQALIEAVPHLIWSAGVDGQLDYMSARIVDDLGIDPADALGDAWVDIVHPDDRPQTIARWTMALVEGKQQYVEHRIRTRDGSYRWFVSRAVPVRNETGCIVKWVGSTTNTHELKLAEEKLELLARELSHRIKNIFALVNGLITLCSRRKPEAAAFAVDLRERIASLARAHDYVRPQIPAPERGDSRQTLHGLLREVLVPYMVEGEERIRISGVDEPIGVVAATALALVVHELATNAVKYGALSLDGGIVELALARDGDVVTMTWREHGGPPVLADPGGEGFGSVLVLRTVTGQLGGRMTSTWAPVGLRLAITMLVSHLSR